MVPLISFRVLSSLKQSVPEQKVAKNLQPSLRKFGRGWEKIEILDLGGEIIWRLHLNCIIMYFNITHVSGRNVIFRQVRTVQWFPGAHLSPAAIFQDRELILVFLGLLDFSVPSAYYFGLVALHVKCSRLVVDFLYSLSMFIDIWNRLHVLTEIGSKWKKYFYKSKRGSGMNML